VLNLVVHIVTTGLYCDYAATTKFSFTADEHKDHTVLFHTTVTSNRDSSV